MKCSFYFPLMDCYRGPYYRTFITVLIRAGAHNMVDRVHGSSPTHLASSHFTIISLVLIVIIRKKFPFWIWNRHTIKDTKNINLYMLWDKSMLFGLWTQVLIEIMIKTPESVFWGPRLPELKPYHLSAESKVAQRWWVHNDGYFGGENTLMRVFLYLFCSTTIKCIFLHILIASIL